MNWFLILKFLHILLFVFWLGTDMGTYYSSRFVINPNLSGPQRATALQILLGCDLGPRIAMPLIMPTGIHMGFYLGLVKIDSAGVLIVWLLGLLWLTLVLALHFSKNESLKGKLTKLDFWVRPFIVSLVGGLAVYNLIHPTHIVADYINWKLLAVCALILCGLGIRYHLNIFKPAFRQMMMGENLEEANHVIKKKMDDCLPYVYGIWIGLLVSAALGLHLIG